MHALGRAVAGWALAVIVVSTGATATLSAEAADDAGLWPFGVPADPRASGRKRDLYNLGIVGLKGRDPSRVETISEETGKRKVRIDGDGSAENDGPDRLRVELLYPGGPAAKAGLQIGDEIIAVNGIRFGLGCLRPIASAIVEAESGAAKGGLVVFTVVRAGRKDPFDVSVAVPVVGPAAAQPAAGAMRDKLLLGATEWLAKHQTAEGGFATGYGGTNAEVCATSMAGLAWLAAGSDLKKGPYAKRLRSAATFVASHVGVEKLSAPLPGYESANGSQVNWAYAHAAIFLGELQARSPDAAVAAALTRCGDALAKNQETSGGWAHGPGGPNALGYVELNIVSGLALCGMGMAQRAGFVPPADTLARAEAYLVASSGADGGVGYAAGRSQAGVGNIGRTGIAWLGALTLGQRNAPYAKKMEGYVCENAGEVFAGHASLMDHFLFGGVAAHAAGGAALTKYWATCDRDLTLARTPDGSFQPRPWQESIAMSTNVDVTFGDAWTTAAWAAVVGCEPVKGGRPGLPAWMGLAPPPLSVPPKKK